LANTKGMLNLNASFTIEMWVRMRSGVQILVGDESWPPVGEPSAVRPCGFVFRTHGKQGEAWDFGLTMGTMKQPWWTVGGRPRPVIDEWQHIAICKTPVEARLYWDGKLYAIRSCRGEKFVPCPSNLFLGVRRNAHVDRFIDADFRAFRVSGKSLYQKEFTPAKSFPKSADTLLLLDFSVGEGNQIADLSGHKRHGTIVGAEWVALDNQAPPPETARGLRFKNRDYVELANTKGMLDLNGSFTVEMWVKVRPGYQSLVSDNSWKGVGQPGTGPACGWVFATTGGGKGKPLALNVTLAATKQEWFVTAGGPHPINDQWQHIAICKTPKDVRVYWDGKLRIRTPCAGEKFIPCPGNLFLGVHKNPAKWETVDADFRAFRVSGKALYLTEFTPPRNLEKTADTLLLLDFSAAQGDQIPDLSGYKRHGTIVGAEWVRLDNK
jgi:hypothetical protein